MVEVCSDTWCEKLVHARRLCNLHYRRALANERVGVEGYACSFPGCSTQAVARGLCDKHRKREDKYGDARRNGRPDDWGLKDKHPLRHTYRWIKTRTKQGVDPTWDDFWKFVGDMGQRPSDRHQLARYEVNKPHGPGNSYWREKVGGSKNKNKYAKAYREKYPEKTRAYDLKKRFGISLRRYDEMLENQNGCCGICGITADPTYKYMAVDHDHSTGKIRGILCSICNKALGGFKDNPALLMNAAGYLNNPLFRETDY